MDPVKPRASPGSPPSGSAAAPAATCRFLDMDERLIDLAPRRWTSSTARIMDVKEFPEDVDATLVEGAVANEEHLHQLAADPRAHASSSSRSATARSRAT